MSEVPLYSVALLIVRQGSTEWLEVFQRKADMLPRS